MKNHPPKGVAGLRWSIFAVQLYRLFRNSTLPVTLWTPDTFLKYIMSRFYLSWVIYC